MKHTGHHVISSAHGLVTATPHIHRVQRLFAGAIQSIFKALAPLTLLRQMCCCTMMCCTIIEQLNTDIQLKPKALVNQCFITGMVYSLENSDERCMVR